MLWRGIERSVSEEEEGGEKQKNGFFNGARELACAFLGSDLRSGRQPR